MVSMVKFELEKMLLAVEKYDLSSLRQVGSGATPLGKDVMEECTKNMPHVDIIQVTLN